MQNTLVKITLAAARINKGLTQEQAAKELKGSKKTLWSWENGKTIPKIDKIEAICKLYGVSYENIIWGS